MRLLFSLWPLLAAAAILLGGNGLQTTLLAVRGELEGFSPTVIGLFLSGYYAGMIAGCRVVPAFVRDVGHIRAFTAFASIASAVALAHALLVLPWFWIVLRIVTGFSFAALQMILESWLNERSTNATRGQVLSVYRIVDFTAVTALQAVFGLFDPTGFLLFALISIGLSLSLVPVALSRTEAPLPPASAKLDLRRLWRVSPVAALGAGMIGLSASAYWSMSPLFVSGLGYDATAIGLFIGAIVFGGAIAQWPVGWLSDRIDRRLVLVGCTVGAAASALAMPGFGAQSAEALVGAAFVFGLFALPCYGIIVAHANDHAEPGGALAVSGGLLLLFGLVAVAGPVLAAQVMRLFGSEALFVWIGAVYAAMTVLTVIRIARRAPPEATAPFVPVPRTTPAAYALDPRTEPQSPA
ncbi:MFS transporter [Parvularcula oceani]|uniref:MFS transporter n=1 Tax=Parvularcula oceani TaxID=1247963 RepID=UPI0012DBCCBE|nr:MFS transporter [Parvularcula oceani]